MMKMKTTYILLAAAAMLNACTKKLDYSYDNRVIQQPMTASSIRLVNLCGATELSVGGKQLTSYMQPDKEGYYGVNETRGTSWFPESGRLGITYTVPRELVKNGELDSIMFSSLSVRNYLPPSRPFHAPLSPSRSTNGCPVSPST